MAHARSYRVQISAEGILGNPPAPPVGGVYNAVTLSAANLDFGELDPGDSKSLSVAVQNPGPGIARIIGISTNDPEFQATHNCGNEISPGWGCIVQVTAQPLGEGSIVRQLTVVDSIQRHMVNLSVQVGAPQMYMTGSGLLGTVHVGSFAQATFGVMNQGSGVLRLSELKIVGDSDWQIDPIETTCVPSTALGKDESCVVRVVGEPSRAGSIAASIEVRSEDGQLATRPLAMEGYRPFSLDNLSPAVLSYGESLSNIGFTVEGSYLSNGLQVLMGGRTSTLSAAANGNSGSFWMPVSTGMWDLTVQDTTQGVIRTLPKALRVEGAFSNQDACVDSGGGQYLYFNGRSMPEDAVFKWAGIPVTPSVQTSSTIVFETPPVPAGEITWTLQQGPNPTPNDLSGTFVVDQATTQGTIVTADMTPDIFGGNPTQLFYTHQSEGGDGKLYAAGTGALPRVYVLGASSLPATTRGSLIAISHSANTIYVYDDTHPMNPSWYWGWRGPRVNWGSSAVNNTLFNEQRYLFPVRWMGVVGEASSNPRLAVISHQHDKPNNILVGSVRIQPDGTLVQDGPLNRPYYSGFPRGNAAMTDVVANVMDSDGVVVAWTDPVTSKTTVAMLPTTTNRDSLQTVELDGCELQWQPVQAVAASPTTIYLATKTAIYANPKGTNQVDLVAGHPSKAGIVDGAGRAARMTNVTAMFYYGGLIFFADNGTYRYLNRNVPAP